VACKANLVNVYSPMIRKGRRVSPSGRWKTILIRVLRNLRSNTKKILNWLRDLDFVAEERDR